MFCLYISIYKTEEEYIGKLFMYKINRSTVYAILKNIFTCFFKNVNVWSLSHFKAPSDLIRFTLKKSRLGVYCKVSLNAQRLP